MDYEYLVETEGGSTFDNLERAGARLQEMLNSSETAMRSEVGWEPTFEGQDGHLGFRHNGRAGVAFADGHVKLVSPEDARLLRWQP